MAKKKKKKKPKNWMCALELTNSHLSDDSDLLAKAHKGLIVKKGGRFIEILFLTNLGFFCRLQGRFAFLFGIIHLNLGVEFH